MRPKNILRRIAGQPGLPFRYRDYGSLATIGRSKAVAKLGPVELSGYPAWVVWLAAHIFFLIGFRNRLVVMVDWAWAYWTFQRHARVVADAAKDRERCPLISPPSHGRE